MKHCLKCGETKATTEFSKNASKRDGLQSSCKACASVSAAKWYAADIEKARANSRERIAAFRAANPEKAKAAYAKWVSDNPEKRKAVKAKWYAANPENNRLNSHNRRARERKDGGRLSKGISDRLFKLQKGKCACGCKQPLGDDYHLDHRMPLALGGANEDWNMQLLTKTCNLQKHAKHPVEFMQQRGYLL